MLSNRANLKLLRFAFDKIEIVEQCVCRRMRSRIEPTPKQNGISQEI